MSSNGLETRLSTNPFDFGSGSSLVAVVDQVRHETIGVVK
jgi:hypothetical protein